MAEIVRMPLMSDTMTEGVIVEWHKNIGDTVESGDLLAEIETDKATMEFEAPEDGTLLFRAEMNVPVAVNALLAVIAEEGEEVDIDAIVAAEGAAAKADDTAAKETATPPAAQPQVSAAPQAVATPVAPAPSPSPKISANGDGRFKASPLAKRLAADNGLDITTISGSGDEGRVVKRDVEAVIANPALRTVAPSVPTAPVAVPPPASAPAPAKKEAPALPPMPIMAGQEGHSDTRVSQMRKTIARRLAESKYSAPHFYLTMVINMDKTIESRKRINELSPVKVSFNDIVIKAVAMALRQHPAVNSSWLGDVIRTNQHIHIGMAVAVPDGLVVPVVKHSDNMSLSQIAATTKNLGAKARDKKLTPDEMTGNTFTISNLGMFGIDEFTAIINPPDACILAVGGITPTPAVVDGEVKVVNQMKVTLSCDHRVVDGASGARFLQTLQSMLEDPIRILV